MPETFLLLLAGGVMAAAAVSDPKQVTLHWLRLAGIIALVMAGLSLSFYFAFPSGTDAATTPRYERVQIGLLLTTVAAILGQLAFVQVAWRRTQRAFALAAFVLVILAGANLLHEMEIARGSAGNFQPKALEMGLQTLTCAGVALMCGVALMDMLLGHAYLTASRMTISPFRRLNLALAAVVVLRVLSAMGLVLILHRWRPVEMLWGIYGLYILTRWLVGLGVPAVFVYMTHDCIRRRSTQSATGILYVAGVLIFIGEIIALYLARETGLPF